MSQDIFTQHNANFNYDEENGYWFLSGTSKDGNYYETDNYSAANEKEAREAAADYLKEYHSQN